MMECSRQIFNTTCFPVSSKENRLSAAITELTQRDGNIEMDETTVTLVDGCNVRTPIKICTCAKKPNELCLHFFAKTGQVDKLKDAFKEIKDKDEIFKIDSRERTILHYASNFRGDQEKSFQCVELIIGEIRLRDLPITDFINAKEELGMTALYLGVKCGNLAVCESLIRAGADWDIECNRGKSPIQKMFKKIPHIIATYFLQNASEQVHYSNPEASEISVDFGLLIGYPSDEDIKLNKLSQYEETDFLSNLCYTSVTKRAEILSHPLVKVFIYIKWQKIKIFFWMARIFQIVWAMIYFWFLMEVYRKLCPYPSTQQYRFTWLSIIPSLNTREVVNISEVTGDPNSIPDYDEESTTGDDGLDESSCRSDGWIEFSAYALLILATFDLLYFEVHPTVVRFRRYWYPMKTVNLRKLYKRIILFVRLMHFEKMLLLLTIYLNVVPLIVFSVLEPFSEWQYIAASVGVFLTWLHIFLQIGKIPNFAVYIKMLEKVLTTLGVITLIYISLIFAFAMVFCILLPGVPSYSSPFQAILKMSTFLIGEVEYERFFYEENSKFISVSLSASMLFYGLAILVLHIALLNFLIALTVTDVQHIEQYTEVWRSFCHVWQISLFESFLSRCPFRIGLPWLRRISVTSVKISMNHVLQHQSSIGSSDSVGMEINIRLKDLPKPLSKEIRELIHDREKNTEIHTFSNPMNELQ